MKKTIKYIGLDVHKNSISIAIADQGRDGEVRYYGKVDHDMDQLTKVFRNLISQNAELKCVYEAGGCGYPLYRYLVPERKAPFFQNTIDNDYLLISPLLTHTNHLLLLGFTLNKVRS
jgi:hypothetical protein